MKCAGFKIITIVLILMSSHNHAHANDLEFDGRAELINKLNAAIADLINSAPDATEFAVENSQVKSIFKLASDFRRVITTAENELRLKQDKLLKTANKYENEQVFRSERRKIERLLENTNNSDIELCDDYSVMTGRCELNNNRIFEAKIDFGFVNRCSHLKIGETYGNRLYLDGMVSSTQEKAELINLFGQSRDIKIDVVEWPICDAYLQLAPILSESTGPSIDMINRKQFIRLDESLAFRLSVPDGARYLYLFYLDADNEMTLIRENSAQWRKPVRPKSNLTFGDGRSNRDEYYAVPPIGPEAFIAITSANPITELDEVTRYSENKYIDVNEIYSAVNSHSAAMDDEFIAATIKYLQITD